MTALERLMDRAEALFESGQFKMAANVLHELDKRTPGDTMPDSLVERYNALYDRLEEDGYGAESHEQSEDSKCSKCKGTKIYRYPSGRVGKCYDCVGKGYQTAEDVVRVKNYWAWREQRAQSARAASASSEFPF